MAQPRATANRNVKLWLAIIILSALFGYLYLGFYYPDPVLFSGDASLGLQIMLWAIRIILPFIFVLFLIIMIKFRQSKLKLHHLLFAAGGCLFALALCYPVISYLYYMRSSANRLSEYHPYLQLTPPEAPERSDNESVKIFFLGGSTTAWKNSQDTGWPKLVEDRLRGINSAQKIQAFNLAKEWYTSQHTLYNYVSNLRKAKPDVIVLTHGINDLMQNVDFGYFSGNTFRPDYGHFYGPMSRLIKRESLEYNLLNKVRSAWYHQKRTLINTDYFPGLSSFSANLKTLIELTRSDNVKIVFLTQPHLLKAKMTKTELASSYMLKRSAVGPKKRWTAKTLLSGMTQYNNKVLNIAKENAVPVFLLEKAIPKSLKYFSDEVHYQDAAYPLIADFVAEKLLTVIKIEKDKN